MHRTVRGWLGLAVLAGLSLAVLYLFDRLDGDDMWLALVLVVLTIWGQFADRMGIPNRLVASAIAVRPHASDADVPVATAMQLLPVEDEFPDYLRVHCNECGRELPEDEAQAQRWGYSFVVPLDVYPFCPDCAEREFGRVPELGGGS